MSLLGSYSSLFINYCGMPWYIIFGGSFYIILVAHHISTLVSMFVAGGLYTNTCEARVWNATETVSARTRGV